MLGFIVGTVLGQFAGALVFHASKKRLALGEAGARALAGLGTTVVTAPVFVIMGVHEWMAGEGTSWGAALFLAVCMGIIQGVLFRGRPFERGA